MTTTATLTQPILTLSSNPLANEKTKLIEDLGAKIESQTYSDWRNDLLRDGYVVIKNAIPTESAVEYQKRIFEYLKSFNDDFDENDRSTWKVENLPDISDIGGLSKYGASQHKIFWDIRQEQGYRKSFGKIWGTDELLVSFDAFNVSIPGLNNKNLRVKPWPHVDQSPYRNGLACIQGIAQFSSSGEKDGSLVVFKKSHRLSEQYFREVLGQDNWLKKDWVSIPDQDIKWFEDRGAETLKIDAEPGDLILWDSRTIHYGQQPDADDGNIRTIAYISYSPASFATEEALEAKKKVFEAWAGTSHWAHDNINPRFARATLPNGEPDPRDTGVPSEKPELTDDLLKLAGVIPY
jgi:hypothetical protein